MEEDDPKCRRCGKPEFTRFMVYCTALTGPHRDQCGMSLAQVNLCRECWEKAAPYLYPIPEEIRKTIKL